MSDESPKPDGPLTEEDIKEIVKLKEKEMKAIDNLLLSHARNHWRKVAMLVGSTMLDEPAGTEALPDVFFAQRVKKLVDAGILESRGNLAYMGYSEVRLVQGGSNAEKT